jgi:hypothetical protein
MRRKTFKKVIEEVTQRLNGYDDFIHEGHPQGMVPIITKNNVSGILNCEDNFPLIYGLNEIFEVAKINLGVDYIYKVPKGLVPSEIREIRDAFNSVYEQFIGIYYDDRSKSLIAVEDAAVNKKNEVSIKEVISALKEALPVDKEESKYIAEEIFSGEISVETIKDTIQAAKDRSFDKKNIKRVVAQKMEIFDNSPGNEVVNKLKVNSVEEKELTKKECKILNKAFKKTVNKTAAMTPWDANKAKKIYKKQVKKAIKKAEEKEQAIKNDVKQEDIER